MENILVVVEWVWLERSEEEGWVMNGVLCDFLEVEFLGPDPMEVEPMLQWVE